jgi:hypothetical protein
MDAKHDDALLVMRTALWYLEYFLYLTLAFGWSTVQATAAAACYV